MVVAVSTDVAELFRTKFDAVPPHLGEREQQPVTAVDARSLGCGGIAAGRRDRGSRSCISVDVAEFDSSVLAPGGLLPTLIARKNVSRTGPERLPACLR